MNKKKWFNLIYSYLLRWILSIVALALGGKINAQLNQPLNKFQRIIEIAATKVRFTNVCCNFQQSNYLGILTQDSQFLAQNPHYIFKADQYFSLKKNNADILLLGESAELKRIWYFDEYKHTQYIYCAPTNLIALALSLPGLLKNTIFGRLEVLGIDSLEDDWDIQQPVLLLKIIKRVTPNARRFISPTLGIQDFFNALNQYQVNYAILRWFEQLPMLEPGEDIDMLVADEDIETIESLLQERPGIIPCDVYTVSGLPGTAYRNMAYYPPLLAEQILDNSIMLKDTFAVPNPQIHFYSLAYHAIYHKGHKSGIPWSLEQANPTISNPEHEYQAILQNLANVLGLNLEITLQGLDNFLQSQNWRPSEDTLARLDSTQIWLEASQQNHHQIELDTDITGLAVFLIRQKALSLNLATEITELLTKEGFNIIESKILTPAEIKRVKYQVRGGNWGKGPWAESGGDPAMVLVAMDLMPIMPTPEQLAKQPHLSNSRIGIKNKIRDQVNYGLSPQQQCNTIHSSDNEREAWNYLEIALPHRCGAIQQKISHLRQEFATNHKVKRVLTRFGRRAKVEVIKYENQLAVKKTFRPGCEKFLQRELFVSQSFAQQCTTIPPLLDFGSNYLIYPYYEDILNFQNRQNKLIPLKVAKEAIATLRFFYDRGYALIDFQPANIIVDQAQGLKVIDFEFLYQYQAKPSSFNECYELVGIPENFAQDYPDFKFPMSYETRWMPYVGLSLNSLLHDPIWLQHLKRVSFAIAHLPIRFIKNKLKQILSQNNSKLSLLIAPLKQ